MDIMLQRILELIGSRHGAKKELCDALGLKPNTVTEWEKGRNKGYPKYAAAIAGYYGVSLDWLSGLSDEKEYKKIPAGEVTDEDRENALDILRGLTPEEAALVRAYAQGIKANRKQG